MEGESLVFAGVEAGGTSCVVALAEGRVDNIVKREVFPTTTPEETLGNIVQWLKDNSKEKPFHSLGIACFGPLDLGADSDTYGYITTTPKPGWAQTDVLGAFKCFECPKGFDTDVNGAAIAQAAHGKHKSCAYVTIGTGVGVGIIAEGQAIHGVLHPEMGHIFVKRAEGDTFEGNCPYHKDCLEGLIATNALGDRVGKDRRDIADVPSEDPIWKHVAFYIAQLCMSLTLTVSPQVIVLGGGVMKRDILFPMIREYTKTLLNGYIRVPLITERIEEYIIPSPYGGNAGMVGAMELARLAYVNNKK